MKLGSKLPEVTFHNRVRDESIGGENPFRWQDQTTSELFAGKNALLIGLPGAFTPTCSTRQLPSFDELAEEFADAGIDTIYCVSVNDAFVMYQWGKSLGLKNIRMIPDGSGHFTRQIGMLVNKDNLGFGHRSWRYAAVVRDGVVDGWFEEAGRCDNAADDPYAVSTPETVLDWLRGQTAEKAA
ncbi:peroxiredoxin [Neptunicoccus cionae]|uniref:Glutathione-dependent peroxiredoxin n=1 Tax=Neptunicoccus cionae TaxID=2035344 RepID=A0A916R2M6_9RHOB|nr:peroxiredoxin [Amylibacter cionae]GGA28555.1 peroxiredoxin [Amylibacter cionae]